MPSFSSSELVYLRGILKNLAGLALGEDKDYLFDTRLDEICRVRNLTPSALVEALAHGHADISADFVDAMTTQETFFFRDLAIFEVLKTVLLPRLMERRRHTKTLRIWSAGCANGQEPYSVAMLLKSFFHELDAWDVTIDASDVSSRAIRKASSGIYTQGEVNRGLPVRKLLRYFRQAEKDWELIPDIVSRVNFKVENLLKEKAFSSYDLILCRNVLIYFDATTKREILTKIYQRLKPDGYLLLGGAERIFSVTNQFKPNPVDSLVYYSPREQSDLARTGAS